MPAPLLQKLSLWASLLLSGAGAAFWIHKLVQMHARCGAIPHACSSCSVDSPLLPQTRVNQRPQVWPSRGDEAGVGLGASGPSGLCRMLLVCVGITRGDGQRAGGAAGSEIHTSESMREPISLMTE